jgi:hypothetical protein
VKITCSVINDLLPLYAENMLSRDSDALVEEHLKHCSECKDALHEMKSFYDMPADKDGSALKKIKSRLRKKILFSMMLSFVFFIVAAAYLTAPEYHSYGDHSVSVREIGEGLVLVRLDDTVHGCDISRYPAEEGRGYVYHITTWNSVWNRSMKTSDPEYRVLNPEGEKVAAVYYVQADGKEDLLIYGEDLYSGGGVKTLPRLFLTYYAFIALGLAVISLTAAVVMRRNKKVFNLALNFSLLPLSYFIAHLLIKGFDGSSHTAIRDFFAILLAAFALYIAFLTAILLIRQRIEGKKEEL